MKVDYLVVGAGFYGATFAYLAKAAGKSVLVVDKRDHVGGNCHTENIEGIQVHMYGPHIFHTNDESIWKFVQRFGQFNSFTYRPKVNYEGKIYSFPINMLTFHQLWGVSTPEEARKKLEEVKVPIKDPRNLRDYILSELGEEIYHTFFEGYTKKQWQRDPSELPSSIVKRLPIRLTYDDNYYTDQYQGIPTEGYTDLINNMLDGIEVGLGVDYVEHKDKLDKIAYKIVYTGSPDALFNYDWGNLEYRSLWFENIITEGDHQGIAGMNYTSEKVPYTRVIEHKHFLNQKCENTVLTREHPVEFNYTYSSNEPFYPINNPENNRAWREYSDRAQWAGIILGGRLGRYQYYDMHQVIGAARAKAVELFGDRIPWKAYN